MKQVYASWLRAAAALGFLASLSTPRFMPGAIAALLFALPGYFWSKSKRSRKIFAWLCAASIVTGAVVGQFFFADGEISYVGLFVLSAAVMPMFLTLYQIVLIERHHDRIEDRRMD